MSQTLVRAPKWFLIVSIIALVWNFLGVGAFMADVLMSDETRSFLPEDQQELYNSRPGWVLIAFAVAVFGGFLGSLGLVMKKRWAEPLLVLSLIGVLAQSTYNFFLSDTTNVMGTSAIVLPMLTILICIGLALLARKAKAQNWIG